MFCMVLFYGCIGCLRAKNGVFWPGQWELVDAYLLLGRQPARNVSRFEAIADDPAAWGETFLPILNGTGSNTSTAPFFSCGSIWGCGHALAAIPVVLAATGHRAANADFFAWLVAQVKAHVDPDTGMLCPAPLAGGETVIK